jgi:hypothetical protein
LGAGGVGAVWAGGVMGCACPGVSPGTSLGGRGTGVRLKNCAWLAAGMTESQNPTANTNRPPLPALVAAILITETFCLKSRQIQAKDALGVTFVTTGAVW